jgi:hypothetical protein
MWFLSAATGAAVAAHREAVDSELKRRSCDPRTDQHLAAWRDAEGPGPEEALQALFTVTEMDWSMVHDVFDDLADPGGRDHLSVAVTRKLNPAAVLLVGLGYDRARRLPGTWGSWLLDPVEARRWQPVIDEVFDLGADLAAVRERMAVWTATGDAGGDFDPFELLGVVPRIHRRAVAEGLGVASIVTTPT